jgi:hypothetical protein
MEIAYKPFLSNFRKVLSTTFLKKFDQKCFASFSEKKALAKKQNRETWCRDE